MPALIVNGQPLDFRLDGTTPLVVALREAANLTGTKLACGAGDCGACAVLLDGEAVAACQISLAEAEGRSVTTIEGLSTGRAHPVQAALLAEQAGQCGFCIPGMAIRMAALLAHNPSPSNAEIGAALTNLCRCGGYPRLLRAVHRAAATLHPPAPTPSATPAQPTTPKTEPAPA